MLRVGPAIIAADVAVMVIGGLLTSTLLTLVIVPVIYTLFAGCDARHVPRGADGAVADGSLTAPPPPCMPTQNVELAGTRN